MSKRDNRSQEEILRDLIREANGATKDLRQTISQAREILPGLKENLIEEGIAKRIDSDLDVLFEAGVDAKLHGVYGYLDEMLQEIAEGTIVHFSQMITILYKVLMKLSPDMVNQSSALELAKIISEAIEEYRNPTNSEYKFFTVTKSDIKDGKKGK